MSDTVASGSFHGAFGVTVRAPTVSDAGGPAWIPVEPTEGFSLRGIINESPGRRSGMVEGAVRLQAGTSCRHDSH